MKIANLNNIAARFIKLSKVRVGLFATLGVIIGLTVISDDSPTRDQVVVSEAANDIVAPIPVLMDEAYATLAKTDFDALPQDLDSVTDEVDEYFAEAGRELGLPAEQVPTVRDFQNLFAQRALDEVRAIPLETVIAIVREESLERNSRVQPGVVDNSRLSSVSSMLLAPYAMDAGLCEGELWSENGMVCNYVFGDHAARVQSTMTDQETGEKRAVGVVPTDSELHYILSEAHRSHARGTANTAQREVPSLAKKAISSALSSVISSAHAMTPQAESDETQCANLEVTFHQTLVVRLDPVEFAGILYMTTVGLPLGYDLLKDHLKEFAKKEIRKRVHEKVFGDPKDNENNTKAYQAKQACRNRGMSEEQQNKCEKDKELEIISREQALKIFFDLLGGKYTSGIGMPKSGKEIAKEVGKDVAITVAMNIALQIVELEVYGEIYLLANIQTAAIDSDQVFALFPFGYQCSVRGCIDAIFQCASAGDDILNCASRFTDEKEWQIRPNGSYLEHSINTCNAQPSSYGSRPAYNLVVSDSIPIPYDLRLQTRYQVPPGDDLNGDGRPDGFDPDEPTGHYDPDEELYVCQESAGSAGAGGHLCPPPTEAPVLPGPLVTTDNASPNAPLTPPLGERKDNPSTNGQPPAEIVPFWRWEFNRMMTGLPYPGNEPIGDYNLIFAGLQSTRDQHQLAYDFEEKNTTEVALGVYTPRLFPRCDNTRQFPGEVTPPGDAFWYWHGEKNERKQASPIAIATAFGAGFADYYREKVLNQLHIPYLEKPVKGAPPKVFWASLFGTIAAGINAQHEAGVAYDICDSGFIVICGALKLATGLGIAPDITDPGPNANRDDSSLYIAHGNPYEIQNNDNINFFPMPEIDIAFAQPLAHEFIDPTGCAGDALELPGPTTFALISGSADESASSDGENSRLSFIVDRHGDLNKESTVKFRTESATALSGEDFIPKQGELKFGIGESEKRIDIEVLDDDELETLEAVKLELYDSSEPIFLDKTSGYGGIYDDESQPQFTIINIDDAEVLEGDEFNSKLRFRVSREGGNRKKELTFLYIVAPQPESGHPASADDYNAEEEWIGVFTLGAGVSEDYLEVTVFGDFIIEQDETLIVSLIDTNNQEVIFVNPTQERVIPEGLVGGDFVDENGNLKMNPDGTPAISGIDQNDFDGIVPNIWQSQTANGTILNDDEFYTVSVSGPEVEEGDSGENEVVFIVSRDAGESKVMPFNFQTRSLSATAGSDYEALQEGVHMFNAGETQVEIPVRIFGDEEIENDEQFELQVAYPNPDPATQETPWVQAVGTATIVNDDILDTDGDGIGDDEENDLGLDPNNPDTDGDGINDGDELDGGTDPTSDDTDGDGISDKDEIDDGTDPTVANQFIYISDASALEGTASSGTTPIEFTVTRTGTLQDVATVNFATKNGTALNNHDYRSQTSAVTFPAGENQATITVLINKGYGVEPDEVFYVELSAPSNGYELADNRGEGTIVNDDEVSFFITDSNLEEGADGSRDMVFSVRRNSVPDQAGTVDYLAYQSNSANAGDDFVPVTGTLTFGPNESESEVRVPIFGDTIHEDDETFFVRLQNASQGDGGVYGDPRATGTILNDDEPTPQPVPVDEIRFEAEDAVHLGGSRTYDDSAASGGEGVGWTSTANDGVLFRNMPAGNQIEIGYATPQLNASLDLYVNGEFAKRVITPASGGWVGAYASVTVQIDVPEGSEITLRRNPAGNTGVNYDWIEVQKRVPAVRYEAENGTFLSQYTYVANDPSASNLKIIGVNGPRRGYGFQVDNVVAGNTLHLSYTTVHDNAGADLYINGEFVQTLKLDKTSASWFGSQEVRTHYVDIPAGATLSIRENPSLQLAAYDYLEVETRRGTESRYREAEQAVHVGTARVYDDGNASGGSGVGWNNNPDSAVVFKNLPAGNRFAIGYAGPAKIVYNDLYINGAFVKTLAMSGSGQWTGKYGFAVFDLDIPVGAEIMLKTSPGKPTINLDWIEVQDFYPSEHREAEHGEFLSQYTFAGNDSTASNGQIIGHNGPRKDYGVRFVDLPEANTLIIQYATVHDIAGADLYINDEFVQTVKLDKSSPSWIGVQEARAVRVDIPAGASLSLRESPGIGTTAFDFIRVETRQYR